MTDLAKKIKSSSSIGLQRATGGENAESRREELPKTAEPAPEPPAGNPSLGPRGSIMFPG